MEYTSLPECIRASLHETIPHTNEVVYCRAPGRINLIGEHTDYNNGLVLPAAIDKYLYFAFAPNSSRTCVFHALDKKESASIELENLVKSKYEWANFLIGILLEFQKKGVELTGFHCAFTSEVPIGAGMSSSSALECAFLVGLNHMYEAKLDKWELIKMSQSSNHNFLGIKGGIMDQFASLFGRKHKLMLLDCDTHDHNYIKIPPSKYSWLLINTCVKHNHLSSGYNTRVKECHQALSDIQQLFPEIENLSATSTEQLSLVNFSSDIVKKRATYIVEENARVKAFITALEGGNFNLCGNLLYDSHEGLSKKYEVSCPELDYLVDFFKNDADVLGSRMMGGGFGGCTINLVRTANIKDKEIQVLKAYKGAYNITPEFYQVKIGEGANVIT